LIIWYIIIEPLFSSYTFSNFVLTPGRDISSTTPFESNFTITALPNTSNNLYISIIGLDALLKVDSQIDLYGYASNPTTTIVTVRLSTISTNVFYVTRIMFSTLIYNDAALLANNRTARWSRGAVTQPNLVYSNSNIKTYNGIYGLQGIHLKNQAIYNYKTTVNNGNMTAVIPSTYFWYGLNYLYLEFVVCATSTQYFMFS